MSRAAARRHERAADPDLLVGVTTLSSDEPPRARQRDPHFGSGGRSLIYSILQNLGQAIVVGAYSESNPLPYEGELAVHYGVSRPVLREAVKMLTAKGLLVARPRLGASVAPESRWNLLDPDILGWLLERRADTTLWLSSRNFVWRSNPRQPPWPRFRPATRIAKRSEPLWREWRRQSRVSMILQYFSDTPKVN